jgi:rubrerythrin
MLSDIPKKLEKVSKENLDKEILRAGIIAEYDAISLYEQMASLTDGDIKKVLLDIAKEEKEHVGEFETLLLKIDKEHGEAVKEGGKEVEEMTGENDN